jgi:hypothetical protein
VPVPDGGRWAWSSCCKTDFAAAAQHGGAVNFVRCHLAVVRVLDIVRNCGLVDGVDIQDETGYDADRDLGRLIRKSGASQANLVALTGAIHQALGQIPDDVRSPGLSRQVFEPVRNGGAALGDQEARRRQAWAVAALVRDTRARA